MKKSNNPRVRKMSALMMMLSGLILTVMMIPAYAQQEVSPAWFDPWGAPEAAAAQPAKQTAKAQRPSRNVKSAAVKSDAAKSAQRVRRAEKVRAKNTSRPAVS
jgi:hypothetical protein